MIVTSLSALRREQKRPEGRLNRSKNDRKGSEDLA